MFGRSFHADLIFLNLNVLVSRKPMAVASAIIDIFILKKIEFFADVNLRFNVQYYLISSRPFVRHKRIVPLYCFASNVDNSIRGGGGTKKTHTQSL